VTSIIVRCSHLYLHVAHSIDSVITDLLVLHIHYLCNILSNQICRKCKM